MTNIIFKAVVGSHAYGTNVEGSDIDIKGVYIQDPEDVLINGYKEQVDISKDEVYYEIRRFIELCCKGNPTVLELLYSPMNCVKYVHPVWHLLVRERDKFLSKSCKYSFAGYAYSQIKKSDSLDKKMNWEKSRTERKSVLDFCYVLDPTSHFKSLPLQTYLKREGKVQEHCGLAAIDHFRSVYGLYYDHLAEMNSTNPRFAAGSFNYKGIVKGDSSNDVRTSEIPSYAMRETIMFFNKDSYEIHCKEYNEYLEWLDKRNTQRYVDVEGHGQKIDGKNLLHCYRLLQTGIEIATEKTIKVRRDNAEFLVDIRKGKHNLEKIQKDCDILMRNMEEIFDRNDANLPDKVNTEFFMKVLVKMRQAYYKRSSTGSADLGPG